MSTTAPTTSPTGATYDPATLRREIAEMNRRFTDALVHGDGAGGARDVYTRDARILPAGAAMVTGREAVGAYWGGVVRELRPTAVTLETIDVQPLGDAACEVGRARITTGRGDQLEGKYVVIWRQEDGRWKLDVDIWNWDG